jgi:hypothetical protein
VVNASASVVSTRDGQERIGLADHRAHPHVGYELTEVVLRQFGAARLDEVGEPVQYGGNPLSFS